MSGVSASVVNAAGQFAYTLSVVNVGGVANLYGMNDSAAPPGSISPTTFKGQLIKVCSSQTGGSGHSLNFTLAGVLPQNFIKSILVQKTDNTWIRFYQGAVSFFVSGPAVTIWQWGGGAPVTVWTSAGSRPVIIEL